MEIITDYNYRQHIDPWIDGEVKKCRTLARDYTRQPHGCFAFAPKWNFPTLDKAEREKMRATLASAKAMLSDVRDIGNNGGLIDALDQNGKGYCWAHSGGTCHIVARAVLGEPYVPLSPFAVACMIKGFRDEGGWGSEGIEFQATRGIPSAEFWPMQSMDRANDNPKTWENAALHKMVRWVELDPDNMMDQLHTALLWKWPVVCDFNWWSHSVGAMNSIAEDEIDILNSWGNTWSQNGLGRLKGSKARPDSAWALVTITASAA